MKRIAILLALSMLSAACVDRVIELSPPDGPTEDGSMPDARDGGVEDVAGDAIPDAFIADADLGDGGVPPD